MKVYCQRVALDTLFAFAAILGLVVLFRALGVFSDGLSLAWMTSSFGASITLLLACPEAEVGRPYPALVGNTAGALVGVACQATLGHSPALAAVAALTLSIFAMILLRAQHPPGGASAMLAVLGGPTIQSLGWLYPLAPILLGTGLLVILARARIALNHRLNKHTATQETTATMQPATVP